MTFFPTLGRKLKPYFKNFPRYEQSDLMPYRRRRPARSSKGRRGRTKAVTYAGLKRYMKKNTELKYHCRQEEAVAVPSTGVLRTFALIPQGDTSSTRDGNSVAAKSLVIRARLTNADTAGNMVRIIIARSRGITFGLPDFPMGSGTLGPLGCWTDLKRNMAVLHDRIYKTDSDDPNRLVMIRLRINGVMRFIDGTTNTPEVGDVSMFLVSDSTAATHPDITYSAQMSFTDM